MFRKDGKKSGGKNILKLYVNEGIPGKLIIMISRKDLKLQYLNLVSQTRNGYY